MMLTLPDGREVEQGSADDRATWWRCYYCDFVGPHVGTRDDGRRACLGIICGGTVPNPNVPRIKQP